MVVLAPVMEATIPRRQVASATDEQVDFISSIRALMEEYAVPSGVIADLKSALHLWLMQDLPPVEIWHKLTLWLDIAWFDQEISDVPPSGALWAVVRAHRLA